MDPAELLKRINKEADRAAEIALSYYGEVRMSLKKDRTYVTQADLEIEEYLRGALPEIIEGSIVVGEETDIPDSEIEMIENTEWVWVIDPIDGTAVFIDGLPFFCVSIALARHGKPCAGVVRFPATGENYEAVTGHGAFYNGKKLELTEDMELLLGTPLYVHSKTHRKFDLKYKGKCRSMGSTAGHFSLIARGAAKGAVAEGAVWDFLGAVAILEEAGGIVRYLDGREIDWPAVIARHRKLNAPVLGSLPGYWDQLAEVIIPIT